MADLHPGMVAASTAPMKIRHAITSPRDPQSGLPTGQRMHKPVALASAAPTSPSTTDAARRPGREFSGTDSFEANAKSPRDVATGQASGKRQHAPITVMKEMAPTTAQPPPPPPPDKK